MTQAFAASDKVGEIVARFPKATEILKKYQIDFCCGGQRSLRQATEERNLDTERLLGELDEAYQKNQALKEGQTEWLSMNPSDLIDYILNTHHAYLQEALPELSELTTTILRVHGPSHKELSRLHKLFHTLKMDLEQHLITEETIIFPAIKRRLADDFQGLDPETAESIRQLEKEHEGAGDILKEMRKITDNYTPPCDACPTYVRTLQKLEELESDLFEHIHLENNVLHPRLRQMH